MPWQEPAQPSTGRLAPRLGEYLQASTEAGVKSQTGPDGRPAGPGHPEPRYARRKNYHQDKILTLCGYLHSSIHYQMVDDNTVEIGSNFKYVAIHQFGGRSSSPPGWPPCAAGALRGG